MTSGRKLLQEPELPAMQGETECVAPDFPGSVV